MFPASSLEITFSLVHQKIVAYLDSVPDLQSDLGVLQLRGVEVDGAHLRAQHLAYPHLQFILF